MEVVRDDEKLELMLLGRAVLRRYEHIKDLADGPEWVAFRQLQKQYNELRFKVENKGVSTPGRTGHAEAPSR